MIIVYAILPHSHWLVMQIPTRQMCGLIVEGVNLLWKKAAWSSVGLKHRSLQMLSNCIATQQVVLPFFISHS